MGISLVTQNTSESLKQDFFIPSPIEAPFGVRSGEVGVICPVETVLPPELGLKYNLFDYS